MKLGIELQKFWDWSGLTPVEYVSGMLPRNPDIGKVAEWVDDYPFWEDLKHAFTGAIVENSHFKDPMVIDQLLYAIAIDNENEFFADYVVAAVDSFRIDVIFDAAIISPVKDAKWQLASRVLCSQSNNKIYYLLKFLKKSQDEYTEKRALRALESLGVPLDRIEEWFSNNDV